MINILTRKNFNGDMRALNYKAYDIAAAEAIVKIALNDQSVSAIVVFKDITEEERG